MHSTTKTEQFTNDLDIHEHAHQDLHRGNPAQQFLNPYAYIACSHENRQRLIASIVHRLQREAIA